MAPNLLLIQAKILMVHKVSFIWLCDFYDFISYFFLISEHPRLLAVSHCDSDTHASGSMKWIFPPSETFFLGLTWDIVVKSLPPSFHTGLYLYVIFSMSPLLIILLLPQQYSLLPFPTLFFSVVLFIIYDIFDYLLLVIAYIP